MITPGETSFTISRFLLVFLIHSGVLTLLALAAERRLRACAWREWLWRVALFGALVTVPVQFAVTPLTAPWSLATIQVRGDARPTTSVTTVGEGGRETSGLSLASSNRPQSARVGQHPSQPAAIASQAAVLSSLLTLLWILGAGALLGRWMYHRAQMAAFLRRRVAHLHPKLTRAVLPLAQRGRLSGVSVSVSNELPVPVAIHPREICVPERALVELSQAELKAVLAHEMAHLVRRDALWQSASELVSSAMWFQPLVHVARRRLVSLCEEQCDQWAIRSTREPLTLAKALLSVATWVNPDRDVGRVAAASGGMLSQRVKQLADSPELPAPEPSALKRIAATGGALLLCVLALPSIAVDRHGVAASVTDAKAAAVAGQSIGDRVRTAIKEINGNPAWLVFSIRSRMRALDAIINDSAGYDTDLLKAPALGKRFFGADWQPVARTSERIDKDVIVMLRIDADGHIDRIATIDPAYGQDFGGTSVKWLGRASGAEAHELLYGLYQASTEAELRGEYTAAIALLSDVPGVLDWLRERATSNDVVPVRAAAAEALHWYAFPDRAQFLSRIARDDSDARVWSNALTALQVIGAEGRPVLRELSRTHPDEAVRNQASEALNKSAD